MVILTDSQPNSPLKTQHTWSQPGSSQPGSSQPATSQFGSEPPRSPYGALSSPPGNPEYVPPPAYVPGSNAPLLPGPPQKARPSVAKRFFTALGYALLIYGFFWILLYPLTHMSIDPYEWDNKPRPEDGNIVSCENSWSKPEKAAEDFVTTEDNFGQTHLPAYPVFSSSESFTLPINRSLHYLLARGTLSSGAVIVRGSEGADPNVIGVEVNVHYRTSHALARARVCQLERPEGGVGVGIFTPSNRIEFGDSRMDSLEFTVTVTIPTSRKSVLDINAFDTNMPNFRQKFESLGDRVQFEHLSVESSNGAIESSGVYVSQGTVKSSNGRITGQYNASDSLVLQTSNGAIDVDVGITNDDTHKTSDLSMKTSNGRIASRISLLTTHNLRPQPKGGHFKVRANTTNGRLDVTFPTSPIDSLLDFYGKTTNGVADVSLHAAYEGTFSLTSSGSVAIDNEHAVDPTGKGRYRTISTTQKTRTSIEGQVFWGHEWDHHNSAETGQAVVQTSNGWARLRFI